MSAETAPSRRDFLKSTGQIAAASALSASSIPYVHAGADETVQAALIGCGGRGTGAAADCLTTQSKHGPIKLVAMADVFENKLKNAHKVLNDSYVGQVDVPQDRRFVGFDAFDKAMGCLKAGDIAILTTPLAFRWVMFQKAIEKGLNVFMEKPVTADGPTSRRMFELAEEATKKNLKVGVGLMIRHCKGRRELKDRIANGEIGDVIAMRAYRMHGPVGSAFSGPKPANMSEVLFQINRFHSFLWASGGCFSDFYIHQIDECSWMKGSWPVKAQAVGGRHYRGDDIDQNFDNYTVEYTYADGTKLFFYGRTMNGAYTEMSSFAHGSKGSAVISTSGHTPGKVRIWKNQDQSGDPAWAFPQPEPNPYRLEWEELVDAIRNNKPYNEVKRGVEASLVTSMGRMAAHTGQVITYDQILNSKHELSPNTDKLTVDGPAPVMPDAKGRYPIPQPGIVKDREY
jgi:predicted dehydrogenase